MTTKPICDDCARSHYHCCRLDRGKAIGSGECAYFITVRDYELQCDAMMDQEIINADEEMEYMIEAELSETASELQSEMEALEGY